MKRVIVTSDSHGYANGLQKAFEQALRNGTIHTAVFLCDGASDFETLIPILEKQGARCILVPGNNDWSCTEPQEKVFAVGRTLFFACHGHTRQVKFGLDRLCYAACERMAQVALYGHTHRADIRQDGVVYLVNPGAVCERRPGTAAYAEIQVEDNDRILARLVPWDAENKESSLPKGG